MPSDDTAAMKAVLDGMGRAAKEFKAKKYSPKPPVAAAQPEQAESADPGMPSVDELTAMLGSGD